MIKIDNVVTPSVDQMNFVIRAITNAYSHIVICYIKIVMHLLDPARV